MEIIDGNSLVLWRALERLVAVMIGAGAIGLGYLLFWSLREHKQAPGGEGKLELPGGISVYVSRVGPGVFFALFGAAIVGFSVVSPLEVSTGSGAQAGQADAPQTKQVTMRYAADRAVGPAHDQDRAIASRDLDALSGIEDALERAAGGAPAEVSRAAATRLLVALPHIRQLVLRAVWDPVAWGDLDAFEAWVRAGAGGAPPDGAKIPAVLYQGGRVDGGS